MEYTIGELIDSLSKFDRDLKFENNLVLTWHHEKVDNPITKYDDINDLSDEYFEKCDKIWIFDEDAFKNFQGWHIAIMEDKEDDE